MSSRCPHNMVYFGPLAAEIISLIWGTLPTLSTAFASWQHYCSSGRQPNFAALSTGRHLCSAGRPSRWALAHVSSVIVFTPQALSWLGIRKSICLVNNWVMRCWQCGYLSRLRWKWFEYGPADAAVTPVISCFIKIQIGLSFVVPAWGRWMVSVYLHHK